MDVYPSKPKVSEFSVITAVCRDLKRSRAFYHDVLGLPVVTDQVPYWVDLDLGDGRRLGLHPESEWLKVQPGSLQIGFSVPDVDRFVTDARSMGVRVLQEPFDQSYGRLAIIADPDGYALQIFTPKR
jgi:catechol 2,3-dioxygenase-like lactoylglutathione lyase family enzyme